MNTKTLVKKLRARAKLPLAVGNPDILLGMAADEIERLQAGIDRITKIVTSHLGDNQAEGLNKVYDALVDTYSTAKEGG